MTKLFTKYNNLLKLDTLTEMQLSTLKSRISGRQCSLTDNEVDQLKEQLDDCEYKITSEHAEKGIEYLRRKCFKRNGSNRNNKQLEFMDNRFFNAIRDYSHFTFIGFEELQFNPYSNNSHYMPIWRIHCKNGSTFDYCMNSGLIFKEIGFTVVNRGLNLVA